MKWYKIIVDDGSKHGYTYVGSSESSLTNIVKQIENNKMIRLDDLLYRADGKVYKWEQWDESLIPSVYINPKTICSIMQFKDDPLVISNQEE